MPAFDMRCCFDMEIAMRDGTILRGDLYAPQGTGAHPALLMRTVFRKDWMRRAYGPYEPSYFVRHGYAVLIQDVRGLGASDGAFDRFTADGKDGFDTIEWMAKQPWCDGQVGMMGNYYAGYLQLMAAAENPPHLIALCPMQTSVSINRDCDNRGFLFSSHIGWCVSRQINQLTSGRYDAETTKKYLPLLQNVLKSYVTDQLTAVPIADMPLLKDAPFPIFRDYLRHLVEEYDDLELMAKEGRNMDVGTIAAPAFYIGGWYDSARTPMLMHCLRQRQAGVDSRVLIAPWRPGEATARADSALENGAIGVDLQDEMLRWFDHKMKGIADDTPPIRYFDISTGQAYAGSDWPGGTQSRALYASGAGTLAPAPENGASALRYVHDPKNPLPYQPYGQCALDAGDERRAFCVSAPSEKAQCLRGMVQATVFMSADVSDADVMLTLMDIAPDGRAFTVCDGATRARYRLDWVSRPLREGQVYELQVLMGQVAYTLLPWHRWALAAYGSAFPKYDVNHGTAERPAHDARTRKGCVDIHCGKEYPTRILLPVVEE